MPPNPFIWAIVSTTISAFFLFFNKDRFYQPQLPAPPDLVPVPLPPAFPTNPIRYWFIVVIKYVGTAVILPVSGKVGNFLRHLFGFGGHQEVPLPNIQEPPFNIWLWVWNPESDITTRVLKIVGLSVSVFFGAKGINNFVKYFREKESHHQADMTSFRDDMKQEIRNLMKPQESLSLSFDTVSDNFINFINYINPILIFFGVVTVSISLAWKFWKEDNWLIKPRVKIDDFGNEIIRVDPVDITEIELLKRKTDFNTLRDTTKDPTVLSSISNSEKALRTYVDSLKVMKESLNNRK
jgi:hypothetical protein